MRAGGALMATDRFELTGKAALMAGGRDGGAP
jgi:hypothetical protein